MEGSIITQGESERSLLARGLEVNIECSLILRRLEFIFTHLHSILESERPRIV